MSYNTVSAWTTAIADAIRAKDGTQALINHQDFPARISAIQSGIDWKHLLTGTLPDTEVDVDIPDSSVEVRVFEKLFYNVFGSGNQSLTRVRINAPNAAFVSLEDSCFYNCHALEEVDIPSNDYQYVYYRAFYNCDALKYLKAPNLTFIDQYVFQNAGNKMTTEYMPKVTGVGDYAFSGASVEKIIFPLATSVSQGAFSNAKDIKQVNLPLITSVQPSCFDSASFDENLVLELPAVTRVYQKAFQKSNLKRIDLSAVTQINNTAFANVANLICIIRTNQVCSLSSTNAFSGTAQIYVPDSLVSSYQSATNWSSLSSQIHGISDLPAA